MGCALGQRKIDAEIVLEAVRDRETVPEKSAVTLLAAWQLLQVPIPLRITGGEPELELLKAYARRTGLPDIRFLGHLPRQGVIAALKGALFLLFTSEWYETFGMAVMENAKWKLYNSEK